jgi:ATP-dependent exoDNAse (exonuclease V) alpha subunit
MTIEQLFLFAIVVLLSVIAFTLLGIYKKASKSNPDHTITTQRRTDDKLAELDKLLEPASSHTATQMLTVVAPEKTTALNKVSVAPAAIAAPVKKATPPADGLSQEQTDALNVMMSDAPAIFLTGAAGTGKSHLLKAFRKACPLNCVVLAPTGMAALNAGGQTIHSFFRFPAKAINCEDIKTVENKVLYKAIDVIIIDEVSMVRADLMDAIDAFMRKNGRDSSRPFGGARIIFVGDLYQLPPVIKGMEERRYLEERYGSPYFYSAPVFNQCPVKIIELQEIHRQKDIEFIQVLNAVRIKEIDDAHLVLLNGMTASSNIPPHTITLTPRRAAAATANLERLARLSGNEKQFDALFEGELSAEDGKDDYRLPVDAVLRLKTGAQVMFIKNDIGQRWVNGTIGEVQSLKNNEIVVRIKGGPTDGLPVNLERERWSKIRYKYDTAKKRIEAEEVGAVEQFPITLAWAITIHKSQGATYDFVNVDLGDGAFAEGQTYVALSRCRTPEGLSLAKPLRHSDIKVDSKLASWRDEITRAQRSAISEPGRKRMRSLSSESATS